jgi:hypothetical protein
MGREPADAEAFMREEDPDDMSAIPFPLPGPVGRFRKTTPILARQINDEVTVVTPEGSMDAQPGDWIASDDPPTHLWPIRAEVFERTYEEE